MSEPQAIHIEKVRSPNEAHCGAKRGYYRPLKFAKRGEIVTCEKCKRVRPTR